MLILQFAFYMHGPHQNPPEESLVPSAEKIIESLHLALPTFPFFSGLSPAISTIALF